MEEKKVLVETKKLLDEEKEYIESWMTHNPQITAFRFLPNNQIEATASGNIREIIDTIQIPLIMKGIKTKNIKIMGISGVESPLESLSKIEDIKREIENENRDFSMESFYQSGLQNGVIMITEKEKIFAYSMRLHELTVSRIYEYLYANSKRLESEPFWQGVVTKDGNIVVQIRGNISLIWLPEKINDFQYQAVESIIREQEQVEEEKHLGLQISLLGHEFIPIKEGLTAWQTYCSENEIYQKKGKTR